MAMVVICRRCRFTLRPVASAIPAWFTPPMIVVFRTAFQVNAAIARLAAFSVLLLMSACAAEPAAPIETSELHNVFRVDEGVFSGNSPDSDAGFEELVRLRVKTVISVDGTKPNVDLARKHGLRYVHLPIGYGGVRNSVGRSSRVRR